MSNSFDLLNQKIDDFISGQFNDRFINLITGQNSEFNQKKATLSSENLPEYHLVKDTIVLSLIAIIGKL